MWEWYFCTSISLSSKNLGEKFSLSSYIIPSHHCASVLLTALSAEASVTANGRGRGGLTTIWLLHNFSPSPPLTYHLFLVNSRICSRPGLQLFPWGLRLCLDSAKRWKCVLEFDAWWRKRRLWLPCCHQPLFIMLPIKIPLDLELYTASNHTATLHKRGSITYLFACLMVVVHWHLFVLIIQKTSSCVKILASSASMQILLA